MALTESFMLPLGTKASSFRLPNVVNGEMQELYLTKGFKRNFNYFYVQPLSICNSPY